MDVAAVPTRERRKRVHSTKCPCCSHEQGKPELKLRQSRKRKGEQVKHEGTPLLKTKRSSKSVKGKKTATLQSTDSEICSFDLKDDENSTTEGRILRSGRSTPVCVETSSDKEKPASQKKTKVRKPIESKGATELIQQKDATDSNNVKSGLSGIIPEGDTGILGKKNATAPSSKAKVKPKSKKSQTKVVSNRSKSSRIAQGSKSVQGKGGKVSKPKAAPKSAKQKVQANSSKVTKPKRSQMAKTKGSIVTAIAGSPKKTSAIEKLKLRAFDQLKEKLEIAFDRSSISVPECVQLLQQITSPDLNDIFYSQPASVDEGSSDSLVAGLAGKSLPEIMTEGMQRSGNSTNLEEMAEKTTMQENAVSENLSNAAHALVSFKIQASAANANSRMNLDQKLQSPEEFGNTQQIVRVLLKGNNEFQNGSNLTNSSVAPDQQFVKNTIGEQFGGEMSIPMQTETVNNSSMVAFGQTKPVEELLRSLSAQSAVQSTLKQESQKNTGNLPQDVSHGLVKTSFIESSTAGVSSTTNQMLQTTNSLIPTTNQLFQTNPLISTNQLLQSTNPLIPTTNQLLETNSFHSTSNSLLPKTNQLLTTLPNVSAIAASNVLMPQPQMAFQFLQAQGKYSTLPVVMTATQTKPTPQLICPNPGTIPSNITNNQQPASLLRPPLNQQLFLPKIKPPTDQKTLGSHLPTILPDIKQPHGLLLSQTGFATAPHVAGSVRTTSSIEMPTSCKLRPILPREPLLSPTFALVNQHLSLQNTNAANAGDVSSNVKQAVKRLVNGRTKNTDKLSVQETTSLPDIASTFNKSLFTANSQVGAMLAPAQSLMAQECSEMANKEQAIKALLSIGSGQQLLRQGAKGVGNIAASKLAETKNTGDLLVVFDTDKGIFKVDDVTIDPQVNTIGKESYTCGKCSKIFTSLNYLARHIKRVCPDMTHRKWKCDHCEKAFRHPFGLQQHVFTHTGERPHKCSVCPKAFYSSNDLRRHSRIHSGERPYKCKHCGKTFATTISLKTHTFIHTGEKPHRCPHCPKTFATSSKLGRHIVTHSEQRPFACTQCPKTFNRSGDLRRHNLNIHEAKLPVGVEGVEEKDGTKMSIPQENELPLDVTEQDTKDRLGII